MKMNLSDYKDCVILGLHDETEGLRTDYIICVIVLKTTGLTLMVNLTTGLMGKSVCVRTCLNNFVRPKNWNASILEGANSPHEFESSQCGFKVRVIIMISVRVSLLTSLLETIASKSKWMMNG